MNENHIRELWSRVLAGERIPAEEERALLQALESNQSLRDDLVREAEIDGALRGLAEAAQDSEPAARSFLEHLAAERDAGRFIQDVQSLRKSGTRRRTRRAAWDGAGTAWKLGLAAAGILLATLVFLATRPKPVPQIPSDVAVEKPVKLPAPPAEPLPEKKPVPEVPKPPPAPEPPAAPPPKPATAPPHAQPEPKPAPPLAAPEPAPTVEPRPDATRPQETAVAVARIERIEGEVFLTRAGTRAPAQPGQDLLTGQRVETVGPLSWVLLALPDRTRIELSGNTTLREISDRPPGRGWRVFIAAGTVVADVTRQPKDQPAVFSTPHGEATVVGTTLRLVVDPDPKKGTRLEVEEGKVQLKNLAGRTVEVTSGHFAVAAVGVELAARPTLPKPGATRGSRALTLVRAMSPNSWLAVSNTKMRKVVPNPAKHPKLQGEEGPASIVEAYGGGILDTLRNRLVLWGGGTRDYYGNEIYAFKIDELEWERLTEPTADPKLEGQVNADGTPASRSPYNGMAYIQHADRLFALGGHTGDNWADLTWTFDFAAKTWKEMRPSGARPPTWDSNSAAYDPHTRRVWWGEHSGLGNGAGLYSYDYGANTWTKHGDDGLSHRTAVVDTRRRLLLFIGMGDVVAYDLGRRDFTPQFWKTQGGDAILAMGSPGADYDPIADRIVVWGGGPVYVLDPESKVWTAHAAPKAPTPTSAGIYGRWRYAPGLDAFIVVTSIDEDVRFYKLPLPRGR